MYIYIYIYIYIDREREGERGGGRGGGGGREGERDQCSVPLAMNNYINLDLKVDCRERQIPPLTRTVF